MKHVAALIFVTITASSCMPSLHVVDAPSKPPTVVSLTVHGRSVRATIAGSVAAESESDAAVFTTDKHRFVVEPDLQPRCLATGPTVVRD